MVWCGIQRDITGYFGIKMADYIEFRGCRFKIWRGAENLVEIYGKVRVWRLQVAGFSGLVAGCRLQI